MKDKLVEAIMEALDTSEADIATGGGYPLAGHIASVLEAKDVIKVSTKEIDKRFCYECGEFVALNEGETHGRAGRVHYRCMD